MPECALRTRAERSGRSIFLVAVIVIAVSGIGTILLSGVLSEAEPISAVIERFDPGERWINRGVSVGDDERVQPLPVHEPTGTVLFDGVRTISQ